LTAPGDGAQVLIIEEDTEVSVGLATQLVRIGCRVVGQAATAAKALLLAQECPPDLALTDVRIQGDQDGIETARVLQERFGAAIVYLVEFGDEDALKHAQSTHPFGYVFKPILGEELRSTIESVCARRKVLRSALDLLAAGCGAEDAAGLKGGDVTSALTQSIADIGEEMLEMQRAARTKDLFLARISHELRTPLASIIGFCDTLLLGVHGALNGEQTRHLTTIQRSGEHLLSLLDDLLDLSGINSGQLRLRQDPVNCAVVLKEVVALMAPLAGDKHLVLEPHAPEPNLVVLGDRRAVRQILLNLVGNAIKFTERGGVSVACHRSAETEGSWVLCEVRDTGPGIREEDRQRLFRPFSQIGAGAASRGRGLGLHLSLKLAEQMQGTIGVGGSPGEGSVFTLVLPLQVP